MYEQSVLLELLQSPTGQVLLASYPELAVSVARARGRTARTGEVRVLNRWSRDAEACLDIRGDGGSNSRNLFL